MTQALVRRAVVLALGAAVAAAAPVAGQERLGGDTVEVAAGEAYGRGGTHQFFFGSLYRELWTAPIRVPVLDLGSAVGGLTPTTAGGGFQTKSLRFRGADGFQYGFRSVDKDPAVLPPELEGTFVENIVRDQTSSQHPAAPAITAVLLEAAGIAHTDPRLVVLPDDPRLGEHRERFAGTLGFFERRATIEPGVAPFAGADEIIDSDDLLERVRQGPSDRIDLRAFLKARLLDYLIGDWDRHRGQWNWMRFGSEPVTRWVALPEDRDQAFVRFDGALLGLARQYAPFLLNFGDDLPNASSFVWNGRDLDRTFLVELEWSVWDSVATDLAARMTDSVIDAAARALPAEYYAIDGPRLAQALKSRRDQLHRAARDYYRLLAAEVDVHATDASETVVVERFEDGSSDVRIHAGVTPTAESRAPFWHRRFSARETEELRIYLYGGDDRLAVRGPHKSIQLRIVGGGNDQVVDSSGTGGVNLYATGADRAVGRVSVDRRPFRLPPRERPEELPPRDWGHFTRAVVWAGYAPEVGVFLGGGAGITHYGFRKLPYASRMQIRAGFATAALTGRAELSAQVYRRNSRVRAEFDLRLSGIEVLTYHGLGNETELTEEKDFYRVREELISFEPSLVLPVGPKGELGVGPTVKYRHTREQVGRILAGVDLYGENGFGQVGVQGRLEFDTRDVRAAATRGIHLYVRGSMFPPVWGVDSLFGEVHGHAATYLTAPIPLRPTLAVRIGGKKMWGPFPFQEAAFIGDAETVRLARQNRFGGDAAAYGNAQLRLTLADIFLVLPARFGIFGLGDVGRVFLTGETSDTWHWAAGGGIWLAYLGPANTVSLAVVKSEERVGVYAQAGFGF